MAQQTVLHGPLVLPEGTHPDGEIIIDGERIAEVNLVATRSAPTHRWQDGWIFPGLVDLHIHGSAGFDVMDASLKAYHAIDEALAMRGCTAYLATTMSASPAALESVCRMVQRFAAHAPESGMLGVHMEGPFIHPNRIGAQNPDMVRDPSLRELKTYHGLLGGLLKRVTLAPERRDADQFIEFCRRSGIAVSAGHSDATYEEATAAFDAGVHQVTHLFNAMRGLHHREPALVGAGLLHPDVRVELIADGIHVHPRVIQMAARLKGPHGVLLVTDAMRAAGLSDGTFDLGGQAVTVQDGAARLADGSLAGSTLTLMRAVFQYQVFADVALHEAVRAASLTPARAMGLVDRGALEPGYWADVSLVDSQGVNRMTWRRGRVLYDGR